MVFFPKRYQFHQIGMPPPSGQLRHHRLRLVVPYPSSSLQGFSTSPTSHPDSFHLFSYERALHLPTCFPILGLASLGVRPRLCRSSWRAFASTHSLMLPSTCSREALLACPPFPPWNLPLFMVESTLSTPCSRQGAALAHLGSLPFQHLVLWTDGSVFLSFWQGQLRHSSFSRIGRIKNSSCSACGHSSQDTSHIILHCPAMNSLCHSLFGDSLSLYNLWSSFWGSMVSCHAPIPWKGSGKQQQHLCVYLVCN